MFSSNLAFWNFVLVPVFSIKSISLIQAFLCMMFISIIGMLLKQWLIKKDKNYDWI
jgi:hypothetical protein